MYLFFDTETTGLPKSWTAPMKDIGNWPAIVQLAWQLLDEDGQVVESECFIVKTKEKISREAAKVHGITQERSLREGHPVLEVLGKFSVAAKQAKHIVAHNLDFDYTVLGCEYLRNKKKHPMGSLNKFCTMKDDAIIAWAAIPPKRYGTYKWPTLEELHRKLFQTGIPGAHDALVDVQATARCFFALRGRGVI